MSEKIYKFQIGSMACTALNDGINPINEFHEIKDLYPDVPVDQLKNIAFNIMTESDRLFCYNPLLIETNGQRLLIDTGHENGRIVSQIQALGIDPAEIDLVFITHAHNDHTGGSSDENGNLVYPNARFMMNRLEWQFWMEQDLDLDPNYLQRTRGKLSRFQEKLTLIEAGDQIAPGVTAVAAYGHTPGHTAVLIESDGKKLLDIVDAAHALFQVNHPEWSPRFDAQKEVSPVTRRNLLQRAVDENLMVMGYHFPFPGLGRVTNQGDGFQWHKEA